MGNKETQVEVRREDITLLPCPFCGNQDVVLTDELNEDGDFTVWCKDCCNATGNFCEDAEDAIAEWNRRTNPPKTRLRGPVYKFKLIMSSLVYKKDIRKFEEEIAQALNEGYSFHGHPFSHEGDVYQAMFGGEFENIPIDGKIESFELPEPNDGEGV